MSTAADKLPARALPILYLGTAHVALALACLFGALWPHAVAGFFYHAWLVGLVHLVTLGWISFSIVGAMYIVGPLALRMDMPARRIDYIAYACALVGLIGMVGHFWIQQYTGMAWSAGTIASGILYMTIRIAANVCRAKIQTAVKLHIVFACVNFWIAASTGLLIAFDKVGHFLPGYVITNVFAHAHLAALGWATMMVLGVGYRMLPMIFPSRMPPERSMFASALLLEVGVLGLYTTILLRSSVAAAFAISIVAALIAFATRVAWMLRHGVAKPVGMPRVDFGQLHAASAAISLVVAAVLGMVFVLRPPSPALLRAAGAYGVLGLIGFLAQMVVAMEARLVPMATWFWAYVGSGYQTVPASPHVMRDRSLQAAVFGAWAVGVPLLAAGMFAESARLVAAGAWALFVAVTLGALDNIFVVARGFRSAPATRHAA